MSVAGSAAPLKNQNTLLLTVIIAYIFADFYILSTHLLSYFFFIHSIPLQNATATAVLTAVATIPAPTIAAGFTLPY